MSARAPPSCGLGFKANRASTGNKPVCESPRRNLNRRKADAHATWPDIDSRPAHPLPSHRPRTRRKRWRGNRCRSRLRRWPRRLQTEASLGSTGRVKGAWSWACSFMPRPVVTSHRSGRGPAGRSPRSIAPRFLAPRFLAPRLLAPSLLAENADGLPIRIVGVGHIGRGHPASSRRRWPGPPGGGRLHVRPCRRSRLVARRAPHDRFRGCRRG